MMEYLGGWFSKVLRSVTPETIILIYLGNASLVALVAFMLCSITDEMHSIYHLASRTLARVRGLLFTCEGKTSCLVFPWTLPKDGSMESVVRGPTSQLPSLEVFMAISWLTLSLLVSLIARVLGACESLNSASCPCGSGYLWV